MLDITELERKFDAVRASLTTKDLQEWLDFAEQRELQEKLERGEGEVVSLRFGTYKVIIIDVNVVSIRGILREETSINSFAIAA